MVQDRRLAFGCSLLLETARAGGALPAAAAAGALDGSTVAGVGPAQMRLLRRTQARLVDPGQHKAPHLTTTRGNLPLLSEPLGFATNHVIAEDSLTRWDR